MIKPFLNFINSSRDLKKEITSVSQYCLDQVKPVPVFKDELFPIVAGLIEKIENENPSNFSGVLIFVPGLAEIQELQNYLSRYFLNKTTLEFLILHSQISDDEQDMVFANYQGKRKIILATNIAESSITISNIDFVIDFCLVKQTRFDEYQNTSILELKWCSKSSVQQRKGRTGRTNKGFYFQLITRKLYNKLTNHPVAEILRTPLETPILKLKIYEPEKEPGDILLKTIEHPSEDKIINTLFRLEKMGALIQGHKENIYVIESKTGQNSGAIITNSVKKTIYKSGIITKVGRIFAELPIDIKYSRLIMIAFALGEIDLGITLAAIYHKINRCF
jgi:ATP-dependent RNA helicase TDRD9